MANQMMMGVLENVRAAFVARTAALEADWDLGLVATSDYRARQTAIVEEITQQFREVLQKTLGLA